MQAGVEGGDVLWLLEGACGGARAAADALAALYHAVREPWLPRALLAYHARTGSERALDVLARAPDPHARHLLDALLEQARGPGADRAAALAALAPLVARRPPWLHLLPPHPLARELLRAARRERDPLPLLHALLALAALVPAAPALAAAHAAELAEAAVRAGAGGADAHVALAARAVFRAAYATHPCTAVEALRGAGAELAAGAARDAWERGVAALAGAVRLHPALVTGSRRAEAEAGRWSRSEPHDVVAECRRLALPPRDAPRASPQPPEPPARRADPAPPGSTAQAARACGALRPGGEGWFALGERSGAESAPHTPLPADADAAEPEPAVEATPENTPRLAFRFPPDGAGAGAGAGGAARAIGRRAPSPHGAGTAAPAAAAPDAYAARLARVAAERRAADSPVAFGGAPPAAAARPEPRAPRAAPEPLEDREVRELTARGAPPPDWPEAEEAEARAPDPRRAGPPGAARAARAAGPAPRRPRSEGPPGTRLCDADSQTVDAWPEPYEFLLADFYRTAPDDADQAAEAGSPCERLDAYLGELYAGRGGAAAAARGAGALGEQLALAHAQLMYERWRREAHAERNRRLLGRCRQVRALELHNAALQDRVRALARERDALRRRAAAPPPAPPDRDRERALERQLHDERAARLRADAARAEADAQRAADAAELQRARQESFEAARHVEALARAALAAERRAEHVRRLRRELLVLAEREARRDDAGAPPAAAPPAPAAPPGAERALRAALARAEAEAEAAGARAEAHAARAHELEAALGARDAALAELKRGARLAAEEGAARQQALQDKYAALLRVLRAADARELERLAAPAPASAPAPAPANCG